MFHALAHYINRFFTRFSYRQRFVFFGILYFLSVPLPNYWQFKLQNFWIRNADWQTQGMSVQCSLNALLTKILKHHLLSNRAILGAKIDEKQLHDLQVGLEHSFAELERDNGLKSETTIQLGAGFSQVDAPTLDLTNLKKLVGELSVNKYASVRGEDKMPAAEQNNTLHNIASVEVLDLLYKTSYTYALHLSQNPCLNRFSNLALNTLPRQEFLAKRLLINIETLKYAPENLDLVSPKLLFLSDTLKNYREEILEGDGEECALEKTSSFNLKTRLDTYIDAIREFLNKTENDQDYNLKDLQLFETISRAKSDYITSAAEFFNAELIAKSKKLNFYKIAMIVILAALTLLIYIFLKFRVLTNHLKALNDHILNLSKGEFSRCFCSKNRDEFGYLGEAFDQIADSVQNIMESLQALSKKLKVTFEKVKKLIEEQTVLIHEQVERVAMNEAKSGEIAASCKRLTTTMEGFCESSSEISKAEAASEGLNRMKEHMSNLNESTHRFLTSFEEAAKEMKGSERLPIFMKQVSDQANMLFLTASIETESVVESQESFEEITKKIQHFSDLSLESAKEIETIIKDMLLNVGSVKRNAVHCVTEIREGVEQLFDLSKKLSGIATAGRNQSLVFQNVTHMMQEISRAAERIFSSISHLIIPIRDNSNLIEKAPLTVKEIENQQKALEQILKNITFANDNGEKTGQ